MEQETTLQLDSELEQDIKDCKKNAEIIEKVLTMLVRGFASEY